MPMNIRDQLTRAEAQSEVRHLDLTYWRERAQEFEARIKAVREMHKPRLAYRLIDGEDFAQEPDGDVCVVCREYYPCDTIRTLDGEG